MKMKVLTRELAAVNGHPAGSVVGGEVAALMGRRSEIKRKRVRKWGGRNWDDGLKSVGRDFRQRACDAHLAHCEDMPAGGGASVKCGIDESRKTRFALKSGMTRWKREPT